MDDQVKVFQALSSEARLEILRLLKEHPQCVKALTERLAMTQPAVSQHLRVLREAGLVKAEKRGMWVHYALDHQALQARGKAMAELFGGWTTAQAVVDGTSDCPHELLEECQDAPVTLAAGHDHGGTS
ncbi:MAG TPA: metalloregulator ArsR/SmtB family transcription factor [Thermoleophilia bacterium]|nr:metalloregulator ArsR/SmtB family transcription factor [Thermoleophilia bacterium]